MSGITSLAPSHIPAGMRHDGTARTPKAGAQAVAVAKQALDQAQGRVDADRRAHSPGCVAVDQKGVDKASAELAHAQASENAATPDTPTPGSPAPATSRSLSITV